MHGDLGKNDAFSFSPRCAADCFHSTMKSRVVRVTRDGEFSASSAHEAFDDKLRHFHYGSMLPTKRKGGCLFSRGAAIVRALWAKTCSETIARRDEVSNALLDGQHAEDCLQAAA